MGVIAYTICPHCQRAYKNPNPNHVGREVICRCAKRFVVELSPPSGRRTGCKYNLVSWDELVEASERSDAPGGILPNEFLGLLKRVGVTEAILKEINRNRRRPLDISDVAVLIESLRWLEDKNNE